MKARERVQVQQPPRVTLREARNKMSELAEFVSRELRGEIVDDGLRVFCRELPFPYARELACLSERVYVVFSYGTPIGWATLDQRVRMVPVVTYSVTTSKHQGALRAAWAM